MLKQSGMPYYLAEGLLLILGTLFYTVSIADPNYMCDMRRILIRVLSCGFRSPSSLAGLIYSDAHIRFFIFWLSLQLWFICLVFSLRLITTIDMTLAGFQDPSGLCKDTPSRFISSPWLNMTAMIQWNETMVRGSNI
jgi:hypothetical protein